MTKKIIAAFHQQKLIQIVQKGSEKWSWRTMTSTSCHKQESSSTFTHCVQRLTTQAAHFRTSVENILMSRVTPRCVPTIVAVGVCVIADGCVTHATMIHWIRRVLCTCSCTTSTNLTLHLKSMQLFIWWFSHYNHRTWCNSIMTYSQVDSAGCFSSCSSFKKLVNCNHLRILECGDRLLSLPEGYCCGAILFDWVCFTSR